MAKFDFPCCFLLGLGLLIASATALQLEQQDKNPLACATCQMVVQFVEQRITNNETVAKLQALVVRVCTSLRIIDWCNKHLIPNIPDLLTNFTTKENPEVLCRQLRICTNPVQRMPAEALQQRPGANPLSCSLCQTVIGLAESAVQPGWTAKELKDAISRGCRRINLESWCQTNIIDKMPDVVQMILEKKTPSLVCETLTLCQKPPQNERRALELLAAELEAESMDLKCSLCHTILDETRKVAGSDKTQEGVKKALDGACNKIPFAKDLCHDVLTPFVQKIVSDLVKGLDSNAVCTHVKLCKSS